MSSKRPGSRGSKAPDSRGSGAPDSKDRQLQSEAKRLPRDKTAASGLRPAQSGSARPVSVTIFGRHAPRFLRYEDTLQWTMRTAADPEDVIRDADQAQLIVLAPSPEEMQMTMDLVARLEASDNSKKVLLVVPCDPVTAAEKSIYYDAYANGVELVIPESRRDSEILEHGVPIILERRESAASEPERSRHTSGTGRLVKLARSIEFAPPILGTPIAVAGSAAVYADPDAAREAGLFGPRLTILSLPPSSPELDATIAAVCERERGRPVLWNALGPIAGLFPGLAKDRPSLEFARELLCASVLEPRGDSRSRRSMPPPTCDDFLPSEVRIENGYAYCAGHGPRILCPADISTLRCFLANLSRLMSLDELMKAFGAHIGERAVWKRVSSARHGLFDKQRQIIAGKYARGWGIGVAHLLRADERDR